MDVFVKCACDEYPVEVEASTTVEELKSMVEAQGGPMVSEQRLFVEEVELSDPKQPLAETALTMGDQIRCVLRPLFQVGMKLEARDRMHPTYLCVATVINTNGRRIEIHFDGWSDRYDYWTDDDTLDIAPAGTVQSLNYYLEPPRGTGSYDWQEYMASDNSSVAPKECFHPEREGKYFTNGPHKPFRPYV